MLGIGVNVEEMRGKERRKEREEEGEDEGWEKREGELRRKEEGGLYLKATKGQGKKKGRKKRKKGRKERDRIQTEKIKKESWRAWTKRRENHVHKRATRGSVQWTVRKLSNKGSSICSLSIAQYPFIAAVAVTFRSPPPSSIL